MIDEELDEMEDDEDEALEFGEVPEDCGGSSGRANGHTKQTRRHREEGGKEDQGAEDGGERGSDVGNGRESADEDERERNEWPSLPRYSSRDFAQHELKQPPILDVDLQPGDLL